MAKEFKPPIQLSELEPSSPRIDVLGNKDLIISSFAAYTQNEERSKNYDLFFVEKLAMEKLAPQIWGDLPRSTVDLYRVEDYKAHDAAIIGNLEYIKNANISGCVIRGLRTLTGSSQPTIKDSLILGRDVLENSSLFNNYNLNEEQVYALMQAAKAKHEDNEEDFIAALARYDINISQHSRQNTTRILNEDYERRAGVKQYDGLAVAAEQITNLINWSPYEVYNVTIDNSVVYGRDALRGILKGNITNSIILGEYALQDATVHIQNSYVVNGREMEPRYIADEFIGNPAFEALDLSILFPKKEDQKPDDLTGATLFDLSPNTRKGERKWFKKKSSEPQLDTPATFTSHTRPSGY